MNIILLSCIYFYVYYVYCYVFYVYFVCVLRLRWRLTLTADAVAAAATDICLFFNDAAVFQVIDVLVFVLLQGRPLSRRLNDDVARRGFTVTLHGELVAS